MKYHTVLQHSEEDCGAACLATIAKHYGRTFAISRAREAVGTGASHFGKYTGRGGFYIRE
jgi:ABC-type bacteriocin/lantibiotic exporter with double-glycine peptidase domain